MNQMKQAITTLSPIVGTLRGTALIGLALVLTTACTTRQVQDDLSGATAQQLVTHSVDELVQRLPEADFRPHAGQTIHIDSHFVAHSEIQGYADQRLALELARRFDLEVVEDARFAELRMRVFYTALGTDFSRRGFYLPIGAAAGGEASTEVNLITLEQFHGVAEMYYFVGPEGSEHRSDVIQARTQTDALGLPIVTIPISTIDRTGEGGD